MDIILASQSPRRRELLERMGLRGFKTISPDMMEDMSGNLSPSELVRRLSCEKAEAVLTRISAGGLIIAADTVVALDGVILGKPRDALEAFKMLSMLSGNRHQVYTGVTIICGETCITEHEETDVRFRELESDEIEAYIATGEPMDKAGAYGIQGYGAIFVEEIHGDYYNVMGLPVCRLGKMLARCGVDCMKLAAEK